MYDLRSFDELNREMLQNPEDARLYVEVALEAYEEDGNAGAFLLALRTVAEARGGLGKLAEHTGLTRQSLYKTLSGKGNPKLLTLGAILNGLGLKLSVASR